MNLHEYQAKAILKQAGLPLLRGGVASSPLEARLVAQSLDPLGKAQWIIKAQIHAGGRGKAGGILKVHSLDDVEKAAESLLGKILVTPQTGSEGERICQVYIEEACSIVNELYVALMVQYRPPGILVLVSPQGGVNIEEVAQNSSNAMTSFLLENFSQRISFPQRHFHKALGLASVYAQEAENFLERVYDVFQKVEATLLEMNPVVLTPEGRLIPLDAKMTLDDNALPRHRELFPLCSDVSAASSAPKGEGMSYVKLEGTIGCLVNGAGLAMATMDLLHVQGGKPANFLDLGGTATQEKVTDAFRLILEDPHVKAIFVNIFGGIMRCEWVAKGLIEAVQTLNISLPIVVRLKGTHEEEGRRLLREAGLSIEVEDDLTKAAQKAIDRACAHA